MRVSQVLIGLWAAMQRDHSVMTAFVMCNNSYKFQNAQYIALDQWRELLTGAILLHEL